MLDPKALEQQEAGEHLGLESLETVLEEEVPAWLIDGEYQVCLRCGIESNVSV